MIVIERERASERARANEREREKRRQGVRCAVCVLYTHMYICIHLVFALTSKQMKVPPLLCMRRLHGSLLNALPKHFHWFFYSMHRRTSSQRCTLTHSLSHSFEYLSYRHRHRHTRHIQASIVSSNAFHRNGIFLAMMHDKQASMLSVPVSVCVSIGHSSYPIDTAHTIMCGVE